MKSFGQDFTATVAADAKDASTIIVGGGSYGAIFDWGEKTQIIHLLYDTLSTTLQNTPEPTQSDPDAARTSSSPESNSGPDPRYLVSPTNASGKTEALSRQAIVMRILGGLLIAFWIARLFYDAGLPDGMTDLPVWLGRKTCSILLNQLFIFEALGSCLLRPNLVGWVVMAAVMFVVAALFKSK